jgi:2Fe-2S ferredoxin
VNPPPTAAPARAHTDAAERRPAQIIAESHDGLRSEMFVEQGSAVIDACDQHAAPIPFCCRSAACGTCRVDVLEGSEHLVPPAQDELELLRAFAADPAHTRLACQLRLQPGAVRVRLRALQD